MPFKNPITSFPASGLTGQIDPATQVAPGIFPGGVIARTLKTAAAGTRVEIDSAVADRIQFFTGSGAEVAPGVLEVFGSGSMRWRQPDLGLGWAQIQLVAGTLRFDSQTPPTGLVIDGVDWASAWDFWVPVFTNITGGAGTFHIKQLGKTVHLHGDFSAGTATAAAAIQISLPTGVTAKRACVVAAQNNNSGIGANIVTGGGTVRVFKDLAASAWGAGDSIASVHFDCVFEAA